MLDYETRILIKQRIDEAKRAKLDEIKGDYSARKVKCHGITWQGNYCNAWALSGEEYCKTHLGQRGRDV